MSPLRGGLDFVHCWVKAGGEIWARDGAVDDGACNIFDGRAGAYDVRRDGDRTDVSLRCCGTLLMEDGESSAIVVRGGSPWL
jgi:hypothetical protein